MYREFDSPQSQASRSSPVPVLRTTKKRKIGTGSKLTKFCSQGRCCVCINARPPTVCSLCVDESGKSLYFCDIHRGRNASKYTFRTVTHKNK